MPRVHHSQHRWQYNRLGLRGQREDGEIERERRRQRETQTHTHTELKYENILAGVMKDVMHKQQFTSSLQGIRYHLSTLEPDGVGGDRRAWKRVD